MLVHDSQKLPGVELSGHQRRTVPLVSQGVSNQRLLWYYAKASLFNYKLASTGNTRDAIKDGHFCGAHVRRGRKC